MKGGRREAGYTLIELLIVLVVLSVIVAIALASIWNAFDRAKQRATMADMRTISKAIELYQSDHGVLPIASGSFAGLRQVLIPYQSNVIPIEDHWGHAYTYTVNASQGQYSIESFGKDGIDGANITMATRLQFVSDIVLSNGQFVAAPE